MSLGSTPWHENVSSSSKCEMRRCLTRWSDVDCYVRRTSTLLAMDARARRFAPEQRYSFTVWQADRLYRPGEK